MPKKAELKAQMAIRWPVKLAEEFRDACDQERRSTSEQLALLVERYLKERKAGNAART